MKRLSKWRERQFFRYVHGLNSTIEERLPTKKALLALKCWWGNPGYSAGTAYLTHLCRAIQDGAGAVLECGSGLSTIVGGLLARKAGRPYLALENHGPTRQRMRHCLGALGLDHVLLVAAPIVNHGGYDWYQVPPTVADAHEIDLVICDGPPWHTRGGRYGLVPVMGASLEPGCRILLDDAYRPAERMVIRRWRDLVDLEVRFRGRPLAYAEIILNAPIAVPT